jgi:CRISPR/Cas system CMR-associated protein Cmr5 small subunit
VTYILPQKYEPNKNRFVLITNTDREKSFGGTMFKERQNKSNLSIRTGTILLVVIISSLVSVSYALVSGIKKDDHKKQETFTFYSGEKQDKYEAVFSDGELTKLTKNGKLLSKDEMKEKEDLVYDRINDLGNKNKEDFVFHFDGKKFNERMKHFGEEMKHFKPHIHMMLDSLNFNFDTLAQLAPLKNMKIQIFNDQNDEDIDIPDIEMDEKDFNIDMDGINKELEKAAEEIKNSKEEIAKLDVPELTKRVDEEMKKASLELKRSKKEIHKLDQFIKDIKQEMVKNNLIKSSGDKIDLKIDDGDIYVNGKKLSDDQAKKYKKLYMDKFGHNPHMPFELRSEE